MKKILFLIVALLASAPSLAGDRIISNPDQDGDIKVKVNKNGTTSDALTVTGSTGQVAIGNASGATGTLTTTVQNGTSGNSVLNVKTGNTATGYSILQFDDGTNTAQFRKAPGTNGLEWYFGSTLLGSSSSAGVWAFGPSSGGASNQHVMYGKGVAPSNLTGTLSLDTNESFAASDTSNYSMLRLGKTRGGDTAVGLIGVRNTGTSGLALSELSFHVRNAADNGVTTGMTINASGGVTIPDAGGNSGNVPHACTIRTNSGTNSNVVSVTCNAGEIVTGGGCVSGINQTGIMNTYPSASNAWSCQWVASINQPNAYAICCKY